MFYGITLSFGAAGYVVDVALVLVVATRPCRDRHGHGALRIGRANAALLIKQFTRDVIDVFDRRQGQSIHAIGDLEDVQFFLFIEPVCGHFVVVDVVIVVIVAVLVFVLVVFIDGLVVHASAQHAPYGIEFFQDLDEAVFIAKAGAAAWQALIRVFLLLQLLD